MNINDLSVEDQELVLAFVEIARLECVDRGWADIESLLASCWDKTHRRHSELTWDDIAHYVRAACDRAD
ncbi:MAG TPA: hypothetical protein VJ484_12290 [Lysobacter sp.]|nr:hypothetical protein [Lysobacter sp.]